MRCADGQLRFALADEMLPDATTTGALIEFGCFGPDTPSALGGATFLDNHLHFGGGDRSAAANENMLVEMQESFVPSDPEWRAKVRREGREITTRAVAGLAAWA